MNRIFTKRVVPAATVENIDDAEPLAEALLAGGLDILEITFRTAAAAEAIGRIARSLPEMLIGAGTILSAEQLDAAIQSGIKFGVAPGLNETLVARARDAGVPLLPGVATPTEVDRAILCGAELVKFFPAAALGGVEMLKDG